MSNDFPAWSQSEYTDEASAVKIIREKYTWLVNNIEDCGLTDLHFLLGPDDYCEHVGLDCGDCSFSDGEGDEGCFLSSAYCFVEDAVYEVEEGRSGMEDRRNAARAAIDFLRELDEKYPPYKWIKIK